jgi:hypothetical protein
MRFGRFSVPENPYGLRLGITKALKLQYEQRIAIVAAGVYEFRNRKALSLKAAVAKSQEIVELP